MHTELPPPQVETITIQEHYTARTFLTKMGAVVELCLVEYSHELDKTVHNILNQHTKQATERRGIEGTQAIVVKNTNERVIGAIAFRIFWGALHIKYLCVEDTYRGSGIGSKLMTEVINYARQSSCPFIFIETFSYQALDFYKRFGFQIDFVREGFSDEVSFMYLSKTL